MATIQDSVFLTLNDSNCLKALRTIADRGFCRLPDLEQQLDNPADSLALLTRASLVLEDKSSSVPVYRVNTDTFLKALEGMSRRTQDLIRESDSLLLHTR